VNAIGAPNGDGPGGIFMLDHTTFEVKGPWEADRGPQHLAYDFWWHLGHDTLITSEWGTPNMVEAGLKPELLLGAQFGHQIHIWDLRRRRHLQALDLGKENQMVLELRPDNGAWAIRKVIEVPAEPADASLLPPMLAGFGAVPPLISDINLSLDDKFLYVSCWGTGELRQYDVSDPFAPKFTGSVHLGGIVRQATHPRNGTLNGGPQMVEISRDGRRVYVTNSLYVSWDEQFYPAGIRGWMAKLDAEPQGGLRADPNFFVEFGEARPHQVRLQGGDASSDSFCYAD
jgi:selenium-binding protein 1